MQFDVHYALIVRHVMLKGHEPCLETTNLFAGLTLLGSDFAASGAYGKLVPLLTALTSKAKPKKTLVVETGVFLRCPIEKLAYVK